MTIATTLIKQHTTNKNDVLSTAGITNELWVAYMYEAGLEFSKTFCQQFPNPSAMDIMLTQTPPKEGDRHNFYWAWFKYQWMCNDAKWMSYAKDKSDYLDYKNIMVQDKMVHQQLLEELGNENY